MLYRLLAEGVMVVHLGIIVFIIGGFALTVRALWRPAWLDCWFVRTVHLALIAFVGTLAALRDYCPLTVLEYNLRRHADPTATFPGSFILSWIHRLIYPDVPLVALVIPTLAIALFTVGVYVWKPPRQVRGFVRRAMGRG